MLGFQMAKIPVGRYYSVEIDPHAIKVLQHWYPEIIHLGDVCGITEYPDRFAVPPTAVGTKQTLSAGFHPMDDKIDLLIGGSPCQDLSAAGPRSGLGGQRSSLFWEFVRIKELTQPRYFVFENVNSMKRTDREIITQTLGVEPILLDSNSCTAQNRKRLFWTNIPDVQPLPVGTITIDHYIPDAQSIVASRRRYNPITQTNQQKLEPRQDGRSNTLTSVLKDNYVFTTTGELRTLTLEEYEWLQGLPIGYTSVIPSKTNRYKLVANSFTPGIIAYLLQHLPKTKRLRLKIV